MAKHKIVLNEKHINVLQLALESYMRLGIGQLENVLGDLKFHHYETFKDKAHVFQDPDFIQAVSTIKSMLFDARLGGSKGITHPNVDNDFKISYEMYQKLRQFMALQREPKGGWSKDHDSPLPLSGEELIEIIKEIDDEIKTSTSNE